MQDRSIKKSYFYDIFLKSVGVRVHLCTNIFLIYKGIFIHGKQSGRNLNKNNILGF